jgi:hypothetical protein
LRFIPDADESSLAMRSSLAARPRWKQSALPAQRDADVAGNATRKIDDLISDAVAAWLQVVHPQLVDLLRDSGQGFLPACFHLVDGAAPVGAKGIWKPVDLDLGQAVPHRTLNDGGGEFDFFILGKAGRLAELFDQLLLFSLGGREAACILVRLLGFLEGCLSLDFLCRGQQIVDLFGHGNRSCLRFHQR